MSVAPGSVLAVVGLAALALMGRRGSAGGGGFGAPRAAGLGGGFGGRPGGRRGGRPGGGGPAGGFAAMLGTGRGPRARALPATARWATRRDLGDLAVRRPVPGRVVLGVSGRRLVAADPGHSVLVVGPTQSHKTSGVVVPAILEWDGPVVAASVKADLARHSVAWRGRCGRVWVYDPADVAAPALVRGGAEPVCWSPVDAASSWVGARRVAADLVETARVAGGPMADGDFWYASAAKLLGPLLHAASLSGAGIAEVVRWLDDQQVDAPAEALAAAGATAALHAAQACWARDPRQRSAVYATAETVLEAFADPGVAAAADRSGPHLDPASLVDATDTLYLCAPAHHQRRLRPVFAALVGQVLDAAVDRAERSGKPLDPRLLVVIDEAANVAPVADLDGLAATASGHGVQLVTVWQDLAQVTARYGPRAGTVVNNHRAKLFLSGIADPGTLDHASVLVGQADTVHRTTSRDHQGNPTVADVPGREPLLAPDALRRLSPGWGVLVSGHRQPCRLRLRPWFADRELRARAGIADRELHTRAGIVDPGRA